MTRSRRLIPNGMMLAPAVAALAVLSLSAPAAAQFETRSTTPVLPGPYRVAAGDFNHDGKLDLVVASILGPSQVTVLLGNGDGTFRSPVDYPTQNLPDSIALGDFNRDGNLDLAITDPSGTNGSVSVLLGNGDGTFQPPVSYAMPANSCCILVGDFNGDRKLDLITFWSGGISVLLGNGDGTFREPSVSTMPPAQVSAIGVGDFNHDGNLDVVATEEFGSESSVQVLLGNGDGTFTYFGSFPVPDPQAIAVADLNRDGNLDLVVANFAALSVSVLLGNGDGSFRAAVNYPTSFPTWIAVDDFNGDGSPDIVVLNFDLPAGASVFLGNGDGTFQPAVYYPSGREDRSAAVGDFNGDGRPDLAIASYLYGNVSVLLNTGVASFSPTTPLNFEGQLVGTTSAPQAVTITNTGAKALRISSLKVQGQFAVSSTCGKSVAPGASCAINATFSPRSVGSKSGTISISDSASTKQQVVELMGSGTVVTLAPASLTFGSEKVGMRSAPQQIQLTNNGDAPLTITGVTLAGRDPGDFAETNTCVGQVAAGASCTITVTFRPPKKGPFSASVSVSDNGGASPQQAAVSGTGS